MKTRAARLTPRSLPPRASNKRKRESAMHRPAWRNSRRGYVHLSFPFYAHSLFTTILHLTEKRTGKTTKPAHAPHQTQHKHPRPRPKHTANPDLPTVDPRRDLLEHAWGRCAHAAFQGRLPIGREGRFRTGSGLGPWGSVGLCG